MGRGSLKVLIGPVWSGRSRKLFSSLELLFWKSVNGLPDWNDVIPLRIQPSVILCIKPLEKGLSQGSSQLQLKTRRCVASKSANPRSNAGLVGSVYVLERARKPELSSIVFANV